MNAKLEQTKSCWLQIGEIETLGSLNKDITTDVCVMGAEIAGMTT